MLAYSGTLSAIVAKDLRIYSNTKLFVTTHNIYERKVHLRVLHIFHRDY